jgi:SET domain-containing protein
LRIEYNKEGGLARKIIHPPNTGSGSMKSLMLRFPKSIAYRGGRIGAVQMLRQICKQCENQISSLVLEPLRETTEELDVIFQQKRKGLVITQRKNLIVIHANRIPNFGNRYILQSNSDCSSISVAVAGSDRLYDLFIDVIKNRNIIMSYKGQAKKAPNGKENVIEIQLSIIPSSEADSVYTYYYIIRKDHLKKAELDSLRKMELKISRFSLSPQPYVMTGEGKLCKISANEFEKTFGVKLLKTPVVADNRCKQDLKNINDSYRKLRPFIDGDCSYEEGLKCNDLRSVSKKSLLGKILDQFRDGKIQLPKVVIVRVNQLVGNGLVAGQYITHGTIIGEYTGTILKVVPLANNEGVDNTYFAPYSTDEVPGSEMFVIDAKKAGNPTRFINHSDNNSNAVWVPVFDGRKFRLIVVATKAIPRGKQILLKYRLSYWVNPVIPNPVPL